MNHYHSVFTNSCLSVPVDPLCKMPVTEYERSRRHMSERSSIESASSCSVTLVDLDSMRLKDFYCSIPDYKDINHLPPEQFYSTLKSLRQKRKIMLGLSADDIEDGNFSRSLDISIENDATNTKILNNKCFIPRRKYSNDYQRSHDKKSENYNPCKETIKSLKSKSSELGSKRCLRLPENEYANKNTFTKNIKSGLGNSENRLNKPKSDRPKRNPSACSITWSDTKIQHKDDVDEKFDNFFDRKRYYARSIKVDDLFKTRSMPSSPLRMSRNCSPLRRRRSITIPKPFKMTERDEEEKALIELRSLRKSFSDDILNNKFEQKKFRANPVPIESRIPLYDKILEDQAMRRAITKINSEAELRAQMKPFSFTKREEKGGLCDRAALVVPKSKKKKKFKARPIPKNLFSNYFYDKMKEAQFFRSMNKRIRAEEMLRSAHYPSNMASRERSRLSTPAAHSDLPIDPSPAVPSATSSDKQRCTSPTKERKKRNKCPKDYFITTSPQPFRLNTAERAAKKMEGVARKMYEESKSSESVGCCAKEPDASAYSALELRGYMATGRSNLAALLRAEAVQRRFESEAARRSAEQRRKLEMKQRDRFLRSKPAWHLVKNNHEEDIAMRLQTRRDEERMRREEFLHEMELMYGRVQQQPMLFERYYAPRTVISPIETIQLSPRKVKKRSKNKGVINNPNRSRKVSINDSAEIYNGDVADYINRIEIDDKYSDSEVIDSLDRTK